MQNKIVGLGCRWGRGCVLTVLILETCFVADSALADRYARRLSRRAPQSATYQMPYQMENAPSLDRPVTAQESNITVTPDSALDTELDLTLDLTPTNEKTKSKVTAKTSSKTTTETTPVTSVKTQPKKSSKTVKSESKPSTAKDSSADVLLTDLAMLPKSSALRAPQQENTAKCYWFTDWNEARSASQGLGRPLLVHFSTDYCAPCKRMETSVFSEETIQVFASAYFVLLKIERAKDPATCQRFGVSAFPADFIISSDGKVIARSTGFQDCTKYSAFLTNAAAKVNLPPMTHPIDSNWQNTHLIARQQLLPHTTTPKNVLDDLNEPDLLAPPATKETIDQEAKSRMETASQDTIEPATESIDILSLEPISTQIVDIQPDEMEIYPNNTSLNPYVVDNYQPTQPTPSTETVQDIDVAPVTQSKPFYYTAYGPESTLLMDGYCPVTLVEEKSWKKGDPQFKVYYRNSCYHCVSQEAYNKFINKPEFYALASDGMDVVLLMENNQRIHGSRRYGIRYDNFNFVFTSEENLQKFRQKPDYYKAIAEKSIAQKEDDVIRR